MTLCHAGVEPDLIRFKLALPWVTDARDGYRSYFADAGHLSRRPQAWTKRSIPAPDSGASSAAESGAESDVSAEDVVRSKPTSMGVLVEAPRTLAFTDCDRTLIADTSTWLLSLEAKRRAASREIHVDKSAEDLLPKALAAGEIPAATLAAHKAASEEIAGKKELFNAFVAMLRRPLEQVRLLPAASGP